MMFEGWFDNNIHYVALFCVLMDKKVYQKNDDPLRSLLNEGGRYKISTVPWDSFCESLEMWERRVKGVLVLSLFGYNCSVNHRLAILCAALLIGCSSQKLNLEIEQLIDKKPGLSIAIKTILEIMSRIWKIKTSARLKEHNHLEALFSNGTRWK